MNTKYEDFSKEMLTAFEDTVEAYEILIETLENGSKEETEEICKKWHRYATVTGCRLCRVVEFKFNEYINCKKCVLGRGKNVEWHEEFPCAHDSLEILDVAFGFDKGTLIEAAKNRLAWLLKRAAENDVVMK